MCSFYAGALMVSGFNVEPRMVIRAVGQGSRMCHHGSKVTSDDGAAATRGKGTMSTVSETSLFEAAAVVEHRTIKPVLMGSTAPQAQILLRSASSRDSNSKNHHHNYRAP